MARRPKVAAALLLLAVVSLFVWQGLRLPEPRHAGKSLSYWLGVLMRDNPDTRPQAVQAVRQIGTKSLPYLIRMVNTRNSRFNTKMMDWSDRWSPFEIKFAVASTHHARAAAAFAVLDEEVGRPAIPGLLKLLNDGETAPGAAEALLAIGPSGLLSLTNCIHNADNRVRLAIVASIDRSVVAGCPKLKDPGQREQAATVFIPVCLGYLSDKDSDIRAQAAQALGCFRRQPEIVVPALAGLLKDSQPFPRSVACQALADFGAPAQAALPTLKEYAAQARGATEREMALQAIAKIESQGPGFKRTAAPLDRDRP